jgi:hypothetical protein
MILIFPSKGNPAMQTWHNSMLSALISERSVLIMCTKGRIWYKRSEWNILLNWVTKYAEKSLLLSTYEKALIIASIVGLYNLYWELSFVHNQHLFTQNIFTKVSLSLFKILKIQTILVLKNKTKKMNKNSFLHSIEISCLLFQVIFCFLLIEFRRGYIQAFELVSLYICFRFTEFC